MLIQQTILLRRNIRGMEENKNKLEFLKSLRDWWIDFFDNHQFFCSVLASIIASIILTSVTIPNRFSNMENNVSNIMSDMDNINKKIEKIDGLDSRLKVLKTNIENIEKITDKLDDRVYNINKLTPTKNTIDSLSLSFNDPNATVLSTPLWDSKDIIAIDLETNLNHTAEELANKKLLLPYIENGQEIYFLGQFNEKNHWDGHCIINVFENDYLIFIMDAVYNDGIIQFYKQMLPFKLKGTGEYVWSFSHRYFNGKSNTGESWVYHEDKNLYSKKLFDFNTVTYNDIITTDQFKRSVTTPLESYYHGNTSDGNYNDTTGQSYVIRFYKDGNVRLLYYGDFVDSVFIDDNAWEIYYSNKDNSYIYCKGKFEGEYKDEDKTLVSIDEIKEIIKDYKFECDINWKDN